ncbi:MAG: outer membrane lipoprotein carrier protein LolA [Bacteroidia bacterium]|nr:outer membrane lipoprotein carrier protein LolA [Bacteroidia bacterium]
MKAILITLMMLGVPGWYTGPEDRAEQILNQAHTKMESLRDFSANFSFVMQAPRSTAKPVQQTGKFRYKKGMYAILLPDQEVYCDKVAQWIFLKQDKEVNILKYDPADAFSVESLFKLYKANGKARYDGLETVHGVSCHRIYLALTDPALDYNQVVLWINESTSILEKAALTDRRQTVTTYEFADIRLNQGLLDTAFRFDAAKHPGVTVIDER